MPDEFDAIKLRSEYADCFEYIVDVLMPRREVHLVGGAPGVGKTTWLLDFMMRWMTGDSFFDLKYRSHPCAWLYVTGDRSKAENIRTMVRMQIQPKKIPLTKEALKRDEPLRGYLERLKNAHPEVELFVIEGLQSFTPKGKINDYDVVARFLNDLTDFCQKRNVTIIGVVHSSKKKKQDFYESPRERLMGSAAWSAYSNCCILVESKDPSDPTCEDRITTLIPRNGKTRTFEFSIADGLVTEIKKTPKTPQFTPRQRFFQWALSYRPVGVNTRDFSQPIEFKTAQVQNFLSVSNDTWHKLRDELANDGIIKDSGKKGYYWLAPISQDELVKLGGISKA